MIRLDIDLSYLTKNFEIGTQRLNQYASKSIDEIMEAEAANGNTQAADYKSDVLNDPKELVKLFKLSNSKNRYAILSNMNSSDLEYLMQFLDVSDLQMGLMFFTKDKILDLIYDLPKSKICSILFQVFSPEKFLKLIPEKELNKFFDSDKLDKNKILKFMEQIPPDKLNKMMEKFMKIEYGKELPEGQKLQMSQEQIIKFMENLKPEKFKTALKCFEREEKMGLILNLTQKDPKLFTEFSKNALTFPLKQLDKGDIVKNMNKLDPQDLMKMVDKLPDDLLAVVITQIDPQVFAEVLCKNFQDVLKEIGIGNI